MTPFRIYLIGIVCLGAGSLYNTGNPGNALIIAGLGIAVAGAIMAIHRIS